VFSSLKGISRRGKLKLASWTIFGTLGCILISLSYNTVAFWPLGTSAWLQGVISAIVLPLIIAGPLFFYLTMKLRETVILNCRLKDLATIDGLTGCLNRAAFTHRVAQWLNNPAGSAEAQNGALLLIDVDYFKSVNDTFGHLVGDEALQLIAARIRQAVRDADITGRMGGEEFAVFLPGASPSQAAYIAERIRHSIYMSVVLPVYGIQITLSVSIGCVPLRTGDSFNEIYKMADTLLYEAKTAGRNQVMMANGVWMSGDLRATG
jgi:diguanylate cyclase